MWIIFKTFFTTTTLAICGVTFHHVNGIRSNPGYGWDLGNGNRYGYGRGYSRGYGYSGLNRRYGYRPLGWGLGGWGLGSLAYNSGYLGYSNPYYVPGGWSGYNYSQPVQVSYTTLTTVIDTSTTSPNASDSVMDDAVAAFQRNDYDGALDIVNKGITQTPDDAVLHEFRALVLFAKQDYQQAAATIHSVLAVGPGWDWTRAARTRIWRNIFCRGKRTGT